MREGIPMKRLISFMILFVMLSACSDIEVPFINKKEEGLSELDVYWENGKPPLGKVGRFQMRTSIPLVFVLDTEEGTVWSANQVALLENKATSFNRIAFDKEHQSAIESLNYLFNTDPLDIQNEEQHLSFDKEGNQITKKEFQINEERTEKAKNYLLNWKSELKIASKPWENDPIVDNLAPPKPWDDTSTVDNEFNVEDRSRIIWDDEYKDLSEIETAYRNELIQKEVEEKKMKQKQQKLQQILEMMDRVDAEFSEK